MFLPPRTHDRWRLVATAALAVGVPLGAAAWVGARTEALAARLGVAGAVAVRIGSVDADLTGSIRLSDVAFGDLVTAEAIEASVALESLLSGQLRADEIRIEAPRVAIRIDANGDSDLARLTHRLARQGARAPGRGGRLRRIVVSSGSLTAQVAGVGEISAEGVELVPDEGGVRMTTGPVRVRGDHGRVEVDLAFARSAADLRLPQLSLRRVLAVGGGGTIAAGTGSVTVRDVAAGRLAAGGPLEVQASVDDAGIPRPLTVVLDPAARSITLRGDQLPLDALRGLAPAGVIVDGGRASGEVQLRQRDRALELVIDGAVRGIALDHRALATERIPVAGAIRATLSLTSEALAVTELALDTGAIHTRASGWLRRGSPMSGQLEVELAAAPCGDLLASLPVEVRGPLDGMVLEGTLGARGRLTIDLAAPPGDGAILTTSFDGRCHAVVEPPGADVTTLVATTEHQFADGSRALVGPEAPDWLAYSSMPGRLRGAFVSAEDGRFWAHDGFDLQQIARSLEIDLRERRLARGGSTISQQLIKNAFLTRRRTLDRKVQEAILTWRLEERLAKEQILERYLNIIELGPRVFGVRAAARYWFDRSPRELTFRQLAFLAAMTSEPSSMSRRVRSHGGLDPQSAERVATILRAMRRDGVISPEDHEVARHTLMGFAPAAIRADR